MGGWSSRGQVSSTHAAPRREAAAIGPVRTKGSAPQDVRSPAKWAAAGGARVILPKKGLSELKKLLAEATESGEEKPEAKLEGARALPGHRGEEEHDADPVACPAGSEEGRSASCRRPTSISPSMHSQLLQRFLDGAGQVETW